MATDTNTISPDLMAENAAVIDHLLSGKPVPAELEKRIRERAQAITRRVHERHGLLDIGVPAIRELRDHE